MKGTILMIDVHSHIIFGVDDGPSRMEQSIEMVQMAAKLGIRSIVATPHFHEPIFSLNKLEENYQELLTGTRHLEVDICLAYEVFVNPQNPGQTVKPNKLRKNDSGIMLIEFPFGIKPDKCMESICNLNLSGLTPIIAHIERNRTFLNDIGSIVSLVKAGCFLQVDAASIAGVYGSRIKDFSKRLIQLRLVDMVASNAHCPEDYERFYMVAFANVVRWAGDETAEMLFETNASRILHDNAGGETASSNIRPPYPVNKPQSPVKKLPSGLRVSSFL
jgi:protein-tyrosine phosphatase